MRRALKTGLSLGLLVARPLAAQVPGRFAGEGLVIGLEYALTDTERATAAKTAVFAETTSWVE